VWLRVSACVLEQGMAEAQYALGMLYLGQGDVAGMKQDEAKGLHWIRKAASKDHGASSSNGEAVVKMCEGVLEKCLFSLSHPALLCGSLHADAAC
jgi:TPR repeat protein